jgi:PAS domain S-box-containing protein
MTAPAPAPAAAQATPHFQPPPSAQTEPRLPSAVWRDRLALLLESTGEGIFGIDMEGCCIFINRAGAELLGHAPADVLGRNMHELAHHTHGDGAHYPEHLCPIFKAFRQALPCRIDSEVFWRRDGSAFAVEYSSYPIVEADEVCGAVITFVDISARRQAEDALRQAHAVLEQRVSERTEALTDALAQLRQLSAYTHSVREEERTRIAREVHDELGSLLVALKMDVGWLDKRLGEQQGRDATDAQAMRERMQGKCRHMGQLIESAVDNVGRIITALRPSILDHQGLWAALEWQAHEFAQTAELTLDWQLKLDPVAGQAGPAVPEAAAMALFRIFQEMLSNVGRHAQASALRIAIEATPGEVMIEIEDDGRGAAPGAFDAATSYGVMGMRERARHLGGHIALSSAPGAGCRVLLRVPLPPRQCTPPYKSL